MLCIYTHIYCSSHYKIFIPILHDMKINSCTNTIKVQTKLNEIRGFVHSISKLVV